MTGGTNQFIGKNQDWIWWGDFLVHGGFNPLFNILKSHFLPSLIFVIPQPWSASVLVFYKGTPPSWLSLLLFLTKRPAVKMQRGWEGEKEPPGPWEILLWRPSVVSGKNKKINATQWGGTQAVTFSWWQIYLFCPVLALSPREGIILTFKLSLLYFQESCTGTMTLRIESALDRKFSRK